MNGCGDGGIVVERTLVLESRGSATALCRKGRRPSGNVSVVPEGEASLIVCYVPGLELEVIVPLREVGYSDEEVRTL